MWALDYVGSYCTLQYICSIRYIQHGEAIAATQSATLTLRINTDNSHHRYDVILLINGLPLVQIE